MDVNEDSFMYRTDLKSCIHSKPIFFLFTFHWRVF